MGLPERRKTVCAIVVNWRQPDLTSAAVASLEEQTGLDEVGVHLEVVIVDNGSGDGSAERLRARHPSHTVVETPVNGGFGSGVNAGIRAAPADYYVLLNNDAVAAPEFVAALVRACSGRVGAVTARILLAGRYSQNGDGEALRAHDGSVWRRDETGVQLVNSTGNEMTTSGNGRDRDWLRPARDPARPAGEAFGFSGGAALLSAAALDEVGLFDESLFMYYEDTELSWRLRRSGFVVRYAPDAVVVHAHAASSGTGSTLFRFYNERNRVLVSAKTAPAAVVVTALARTTAATIRSVLQAVLHRSAESRAEARGRVRSLSAALRGLPAALAERRRIDHSATVSRGAVAHLLVAD
jgi:GT2 family glycosyltransferase